MKKLYFLFQLMLGVLLLLSCNEEILTETISETTSQEGVHPDFIRLETTDFVLEETEHMESGRIQQTIYKDRSGTIEMAIFSSKYVLEKQQWNEYQGVGAGFICVGGGVKINDASIDQGSFITASYPHANKKGWMVQTKDHIRIDPTSITKYAIGLKIQGLTEFQLKSYINHFNVTSVVTAHPSISAQVNSNYHLIGGGAKVNWSGSGNLLVNSNPSNSTTWTASSKDHKKSSPASITTTAIGLWKNIPGLGAIQVDIFYGYGAAYANGGELALQIVPSSAAGYVMSSVGAGATVGGAGRMLMSVFPYEAGPYNTGVKAVNKDHIDVSNGTLFVYAVGIRK